MTASESFEVDLYSLTVSFLELFYNEHRIGSGTGFFWSNDAKIWLISNWHIFSGRKPQTGQPMDADGAIPNKIKMIFYCAACGKFEARDIALTGSDGTSLWMQHPTRGQKVDVAAIDVTSSLHGALLSPTLNNGRLITVNTLPAMDDVKLRVALDIFVLGFPLGLRPTAYLPIWKRASIATEPQFKGALPSFLIDTATRKGMSGAPVLFRSNWYQGKSGQFHMKGDATKFLGVYSGRHVGAQEEEAQLGIVWKTEVVLDIVTQGAPGNFELI